MSIMINGKVVAGAGRPGTSAYEAAQKGGYTGTEAEFNEALANIGLTGADLQTLTFTGGSTATYDGSTAVSVAIPTTLPNPKALNFTGAVTGTYDGSSTLTINIPEGGTTDGGETATVVLDTTLTKAGYAADAAAVGEAISSKPIWYADTTPPTNANLLWIDTNLGNGVLKYLPSGSTNTSSNWIALSAIYS